MHVLGDFGECVYLSVQSPLTHSEMVSNCGNFKNYYSERYILNKTAIW